MSTWTKVALRATVGVLGLAVIACDGTATASLGDAASPVSSPEGCSVALDAPLALAVSHRANSPAELPSQVRQMVARSIAAVPGGSSGPTISLINVDGTPSVYTSANYQPIDSNEFGRADQDSEFLTGFDQSTSAMLANDPEVDVLAALEEAAVAAGRPGAGTLVLVDSGLSTTGVLDFTVPGFLDAPPAEVVAFLRAHDALPDLTGLTVILVGLGEVAKPQPQLGARKRSVIELWSAIAHETAACVTVLEIARPAEPVANVLPVSLVPAPPPVTFQPGGQVVLPDVAFEPGEGELRDPSLVAELLQPVVAQLKADPARRLLLTGTTARWGSREYQIDLAERRIATVRDELLARSGADPSRIETQALGSWFREYVPDNGPGGVLLPGPAQQNRTVRIDPCAPACPRES
jgi:OOP family OmpA-OmpF porin